MNWRPFELCANILRKKANYNAHFSCKDRVISGYLLLSCVTLVSEWKYTRNVYIQKSIAHEIYG